MDSNKINEKEILSDVLLSEKFIINAYNNYANESSSPIIRDAFLNILSEEHYIQAEVFDQLKKRGWYNTEDAPKQKIEQTYQRYKTN